MKWLATEIADGDGNYRVLPLNVSALYASFSNDSSPRAGIVTLCANYWNSGSIYWLRVQSRVFRHQLPHVQGFILPVSLSLWLPVQSHPHAASQLFWHRFSISLLTYSRTFTESRMWRRSCNFLFSFKQTWNELRARLVAGFWVAVGRQSQLFPGG